MGPLTSCPGQGYDSKSEVMSRQVRTAVDPKATDYAPESVRWGLRLEEREPELVNDMTKRFIRSHLLPVAGVLGQLHRQRTKATHHKTRRADMSLFSRHHVGELALWPTTKDVMIGCS